MLANLTSVHHLPEYPSKDLACLLTLESLGELGILSSALHVRSLRYNEVM